MATDESSLTDFEYRVVGIEGLEGRIYNQEHHAKIAIVNAWTWGNTASIREHDLKKHIQIRLVNRGPWKNNIREVFGLE